MSEAERLRDAYNERSRVGLAKRIEVIEVRTSVGRGRPGTDDTPVRGIIEYWSLDGVLLATYDQWKEEELKKVEVWNDE